MENPKEVFKYLYENFTTTDDYQLVKIIEEVAELRQEVKLK